MKSDTYIYPKIVDDNGWSYWSYLIPGLTFLVLSMFVVAMVLIFRKQNVGNEKNIITNGLSERYIANVQRSSSSTTN